MTTISVAEFFPSIFQSCEGLIELRTLTPSGKPNGRAFMSPDDVQVAVQFMKTHAADHVYFGVATRRDDTGGALENCAHLPALFVDLDFKHTPEADARRRLAECPLPPSCSVQSGGGLHVYWLLREPLDLREDSNRVMARALLRRLAQFLVADLSSAEPARVLRVPGSLNVKPDYVPPRHVVIETLAEHRYNLGEFADILPPEPKEGRTNGTTFVSPVRILDGERSNILYKTARSLKAKGLSREAMAAAVRAENGAKCEPPLSDAELEDLIVHAWTQADRPTFAAAAPETVEAKPLDTVRLTDVGNAERFTHAHRGVVHHCYPLRTWFVCTPDGLWERDAGHRVMQLAKETVRSIYDEAQHEDGDERRTKLAAHAVKSENAQRLQAMIDLARSEQGIAIAPDAFDRNPWVFSVANGVVDLTTGLLRPRQRDDLITKQSPVRFDPNATCPTWLRFLLRIFQEDQSLIGYIQEIAGYCLTGLTVEQAFFLLWGSGSNGKSTLLKVLLKLFGDYGLQVPADTFLSRTQDGRATPDLARLQGARLAVAIESDEGGRLAEGTIKQMTGGDRIAARRLYQDFVEFEPTHKILFSTNHKPRVRDNTHAMWRRMRLLPFTVQIADAEQDPHLADKLLVELPGILNWALTGCLAWQRAGRLQTPEPVVLATNIYRSEQDVLDDFLRERCVCGAGESVVFAELRQRYIEWAKEIAERPLSSKALALALQERGFQPDKRQRARPYSGLRLRTFDDEITDAQQSPLTEMQEEIIHVD